MSSGQFAQAAAGIVYITAWIDWLRRFRGTIEPSIRRAVGRLLGVHVIWGTTSGPHGPSRAWQVVGATSTRVSRLVGLAASVMWLFAGWFPTCLLMLSASLLGFPSIHTEAALLVLSMPLTMLMWRGLARPQPLPADINEH